jgi:hypothetical protein
LVFGGLGFLWWRFGRDRRFVSMHYLTGDTAEERVPLFSRDQVVVEFEPPEKLRPGQMGLLIDESADTLDVTATVIDLAARGYLTIKELPSKGWFGKTDWQLDELKPADAGLMEYEKIVLYGLFEKGSSTKLSDLRNTFYKDLARARDALYKDAIARKWFPRNPNTVRALALVFGILTIFAGLGLTIYLGQRWGAGLAGLAVAAGGVLAMIFSRAMPRRTALGPELPPQLLDLFGAARCQALLVDVVAAARAWTGTES